MFLIDPKKQDLFVGGMKRFLPADETVALSRAWDHRDGKKNHEPLQYQQITAYKQPNLAYI